MRRKNNATSPHRHGIPFSRQDRLNMKKPKKNNNKKTKQKQQHEKRGGGERKKKNIGTSPWGFPFLPFPKRPSQDPWRIPSARGCGPGSPPEPWASPWCLARPSGSAARRGGAAGAQRGHSTKPKIRGLQRKIDRTWAQNRRNRPFSYRTSCNPTL